MGEETAIKGSLLGKAISKRLEQLSMSRRELCRRVNISRQTLHLLEHEPDRNFAPQTFNQLDRGLKWKVGTAESLHKGIQPRGHDMEAEVRKHIKSILAHLQDMDIDQLEREVLMLEEESYGPNPTRTESGTPEINTIITKLLQTLAADVGETNARPNAS